MAKRPVRESEKMPADSADTSSNPVPSEAPENTLAEITGKAQLRDRTVRQGFLSRMFTGWMVRSEIEHGAELDKAEAQAVRARAETLRAGSELAAATEEAHEANARLQHIQSNLDALQDRVRQEYEAEHEEKLAEYTTRLKKARLKKELAEKETDVLRAELKADLDVRDYIAGQRLEAAKRKASGVDESESDLAQMVRELGQLDQERDRLLAEATSDETRELINEAYKMQKEQIRNGVLYDDGE